MVKSTMWVCAIILSGLVGFHYGKSVESVKWYDESVAMRNKQDELTRIVKDRDVALAAAQLEAATKRESEGVVKEVIYRDKIKTVTVYQCVRDSGLLDLYDAVHGVK
ncbi:MAG: hypothetical protein ACRC8W_19920 [Plesiomonas shigelloides]